MKYIFYLCLLILSGCSVRKKQNYDLLRSKELIAKFAEIPDAPLHTSLQQVATDDQSPDQIQMFYTTSMKTEDLVLFYQQNMERLGWMVISESYVQDWLLQYGKPDQICSILIKNNKLVIFVSKRKGV